MAEEEDFSSKNSWITPLLVAALALAFVASELRAEEPETPEVRAEIQESLGPLEIDREFQAAEVRAALTAEILASLKKQLAASVTLVSVDGVTRTRLASAE